MRVQLGFQGVVSASVLVAVRPRRVFQNESAVSAILPAIPEALARTQRPLMHPDLNNTTNKSKQSHAIRAGSKRHLLFQ
jgi:hypothetical protein